MARLYQLKNFPELVKNHTHLAETGCRFGESLEYAKSLGLECFSCDTNPESVKIAKENTGLSTIYNMDSIEFLNWYCEKYNQEKTVFWLDAHWPGRYSELEFDEDQNFPLVDELQVITDTKDGWEYDIFLLDDMDFIPGSPSFRDQPEDKIARFTYNQLTQYLRHTHDLEIVETTPTRYKKHPILVATPKKEATHV